MNLLVDQINLTCFLESVSCRQWSWYPKDVYFFVPNYISLLLCWLLFILCGDYRAIPTGLLRVVLRSSGKSAKVALKSQWWSDLQHPCWTNEAKHLVICMDLLSGGGARRAMQGHPSRTQVTSASHRSLWPARQNNRICVWSLDKVGCVSENIIHGSQMEAEENLWSSQSQDIS